MLLVALLLNIYGSSAILLDVPTVTTAAQSLNALSTYGAFKLPSSTVDSRIVAQLHSWFTEHISQLPSYPVRNPHERSHRLALPGDANGDVSHAISSILRVISGGALAREAVLTELGVFIVSAGAAAQDLHQDRLEDGAMSCQLALHDTPIAAGGLELALDSWERAKSGSSLSDGFTDKQACQEIGNEKILSKSVESLDIVQAAPQQAGEVSGT
jgi:hypothetical protein